MPHPQLLLVFLANVQRKYHSGDQYVMINIYDGQPLPASNTNLIPIMVFLFPWRHFCRSKGSTRVIALRQ